MDDKVILLYSENGNDICPVCKNIIKNGIETNCGHTFCTACITNSLAFNSDSVLNCPVCQSMITKILQDPSSFNNVIKEYNDEIKKEQKRNSIYNIFCIIIIVIAIIAIAILLWPRGKN